MSKIKIAVIGSCVSRDSFNSKFIKDYRQYYKCVLTQNHMSMISLMAEPIPFMPKKLNGDITDFNKQILMTELTKGVWDSLKITNPDYLILDFYADVYFGVIRVGNSFISDKTHVFKRTPFFSQFETKEKVKIENDYNEFMALWKRSVDSFMKKMMIDFPNIKVIVNKVHFTDYYITKDGKEKKKISDSGKYKKVDTDQINNWLDEFYKYFEENYHVDFIEYDREYLSHEDHIWEFYYVHYTQEFYDDFTTKLLSIILDDLYSKSNKLLDKPNVNYENNLIKNASFNNGKVFWSYWQDDFVIKDPEDDLKDSNIVEINKKELTKKEYKQIWSHPVEINTTGNQEYTVSFDIKINDISKVDADKFIFSMRTFNKVDDVLQKDAVWHQNINVNDVKTIKNGEWVRCTYVFKPIRGKFLKVGPYLIKNGQVSWRRIKLQLGNHQPEISTVSKIEKASLLKTIKSLIKVK